MKKIWGLTIGGLHSKILAVLLVFLLAIVGFNTTVSIYKASTLKAIVAKSGKEQQEAVEKISGDAMYTEIEQSLTKINTLRAAKIDDEFTQIKDNISMLREMAENLFENADNLEPAHVPLPDPNNEDELEIHLLFEEGIDYTQSEYVGIAGHMSNTLMSLVETNDKISGCYIGLSDGTHIGASHGGSNKFDENGNQKPYPVRKRPWYIGAVEKGDIFFTGVVRDAFSNSFDITCSAPVIVNGKTVAVVGIDIITNNIDELIQSSNSEYEFIFIINQDGQIIALPENNGIFTLEDSEAAPDLRESDNKELAAFITKAMAGSTDLETVKLNDKEYYLMSAPMETIGWAVVSVVDQKMTENSTRTMINELNRINSSSTETFRTATSRQNKITIIGIISIIIIGSISALILATKIVRPIESMTEEIDIGAQTGKLFEMKDVYRTGDEIQLLAESFDDLSRKTKQYIDSITEITAEKERIGTELALATQIQAAMLPHIFPPYPDRNEFEIYAMMNPAREVGGDFYDFFLIDEDHLALVMADVSGKGIPAALFMMISKTILQSVAMFGQSPAEVLTKTNEALCSNNQVEMFVTVWLGILELSTGKLTASNAGHEYPALKRSNGKYELYKDKHGMAIGCIDGIVYKEYELNLNPGDKLFLYTDGVPEATDNAEKMFGIDRMLDALNQAEHSGPEELLHSVRDAISGFVKEAEQFDDLTMLSLEYKGSRPDKQDKP